MVSGQNFKFWGKKQKIEITGEKDRRLTDRDTQTCKLETKTLNEYLRQKEGQTETERLI